MYSPARGSHGTSNSRRRFLLGIAGLSTIIAGCTDDGGDDESAADGDDDSDSDSGGRGPGY